MALVFARDSVRELLACLTDAQRDVVLLRFVADLSLGAVARALNRPVGAVKALQRRALATLRRSEAFQHSIGLRRALDRQAPAQALGRA